MNTKGIERLIYEYHWRKKEVARIESILWGAGKAVFKSVGVAQYGVEATLPKPNTSLKSYAEMDYMDAREKRLLKRYEEYTEKVTAVEAMAELLYNDKHLIILDCMMEGMSYRSIADHLGISTTKLWHMKCDMLNIIQKEQKEHKEHYQCV